MDIDLHGLLLLSRVAGVGNTRLRSLIDHFRDPAAVLSARPGELLDVEGIDRRTALAIAHFSRSPDHAEARRYADTQVARLPRSGARVVTLWHEEYPALLRMIYDAPPLLWVKGALEPPDSACVAVVGTRRPSAYGLQMAGRLSTGLALAGIPVVSGLALGIDSAAHTAAVRAGGRTIAVIGSGVDIVYPYEHRRLAEQLLDKGALLSECPLGAKPDAVNFPRRNRIISGMSLGTLVVETGCEGGAMITARVALDQDREVFAVPAPVDERRPSGANLLIKEGNALLVESVEEVIKVLAPKLHGIAPARNPPPVLQLSLFETRLYEEIGDTPVHIDALAARTGLSASDALVHLLSLEFKNLVRQTPGKLFVRC